MQQVRVNKQHGKKNDKNIDSFEFSESLEDWKDVIKEQRFTAFNNSSSFVGNVRYDRDTNEMTMILNSKEYVFCNVPERKFQALKGGNSTGATFNREIKGQHDC